MWPKLPWRRSRGSSPMNERLLTDHPEGSDISLQQGISTTEETRLDYCEPRRIQTLQGAVLSARFLSDGEHILSGGENGTVRRLNIAEDHDHPGVVGNAGASAGCSSSNSCAVVSKDGRWIVVVAADGKRVSVWDAVSNERAIESVEVHEHKITALDVSPDASKIASGSQDGTVVIWCLKSGKRLAGPFKHGQGSVLTLRFSPAGDHIAYAGWSYSVHVCSLRSDGDYRLPMSIPTDPAYSLAWSNDGRRLFCGSGRYQGSILCLDLTSSIPATSKWPGHPHFDSITTLCLANNGRFIVSASKSENSIKILDMRQQSEICVLKHDGGVRDADVSPDDTRLVCGLNDGQVFIWDLQKFLPKTYFFHSLTARLIPSSWVDSPPILTDVYNMAYIAWRRGELTEAEIVLSGQIERRSGPLHYHLANRALVRARLGNLTAASDDAQESYFLQPSLVALFAKSLVLSGHGLYNAAIKILDSALELCDQTQMAFVGVIKAIIIFDVGLREEGMRYLKDLTFRSPEVTQPCALVEAKMYFSLAQEATSCQDYYRAIQLFAQARELCPSGQYPEMDAISLMTGWTFDGLRLTIYQDSCETCYAAGRIREALDILGEMERYFSHDTQSRSDLSGWLAGFKSRCIELLRSQGDEAMSSGKYDSAILLYSAALEMGSRAEAPVVVSALFVKRSKAQAESHLWEEALKDADEAIRLNDSSPWGYERRHAALHRLECYSEAIGALTTMISKLDDSPDPEVRKLRNNYINPSDTHNVVWEVFRQCVDDSPFRLIDTLSGRLCDAENRGSIFKEDPIFLELVSSMTTQLEHHRIQSVTRKYFRYAMLSHRWEAKELELADVQGRSVYELDASPAVTKIQRFCHLARDAKCRWAWSDTCCINKEKDVEFEKSINSMFRWYHGSAITLVYLVGVPPLLIRGALQTSVWMTRGWTLQELLAPPVVRFYYEDWTPYLNDTSLNHKKSVVIMDELEDATGVTTRDLLALQPGPEDVRVKLHLASTRETTVPEDMAYGLFGIFGVTMAIIHGETQEKALGRLFQEIVARSGNVACLAWVGRPSSAFNSAFPDRIQAYMHDVYTIPDAGVGEADIGRQAAELRQTWPHEEEERIVGLYWTAYAIPLARCANQHLYLPCIAFPLEALIPTRIEQTDDVQVYRATTSELEDTDIRVRTGETLLSQNQGPKDLVLACPWIHELLHGTAPSFRRSRPRRWSSFASDRDTGSAGLERSDDVARASRLAVRLRGPLGAILLLAQGHGQHRRVATEYEIVIRLRRGASLDDVRLETLEVV